MRAIGMSTTPPRDPSTWLELLLDRMYVPFVVQPSRKGRVLMSI